MNILEELVKELKISGKLNSHQFSETRNLEHSNVVGQLMSLSSQANKIILEKETIKKWTLTNEGIELVENGSHEYRLFCMIPDSGILIDDLKNNFNEIDIALNKAQAYRWLRVAKNEGMKIYKTCDKVEDITRNDLNNILKGNCDNLDKKRIDELKKRKLITLNTINTFNVSPGPSFHEEQQKYVTDLTSEMITNNSWENVVFKPYNFVSLGLPSQSGCFHPLMKVKSEIQQIFLNMGFSEMPTNNYVESSFWNFDALFQPQQHPSREAHDTFFLKNPSTSTLSDVPPQYLDDVKKMHEIGNDDSLGYRYDWKITDAEKLILRTHTTAVSARMLHKLGQEKVFRPVKYFSIDRVFRNESSDSTHLSEFHQIEGVVADRGLSLSHLIGILNEFFNQLGIHKLKFKPAFNPYTEPSMEVFGLHPGLGKWVEIGNSGMFRREMLDPMGIPSDVNVIAWGLSLERPTMIKYGISNIRSLIGHKIDLEQLNKYPACLIKGSSNTTTL